MEELSFVEKPIPLDKFPLRFSIMDKDGPAPTVYPLHWHEHMELLYSPDGSFEVSSGNEIFTSEKEDLVIINQNELHSTKRISNCTLYCLRVSPAFFSDIDFDNILFQTHIKKDANIKEYIEKLFTENNFPREGSDTKIKGLSYMLMTRLIRNYKVENPNILKKKKKQLKISSILSYISTYYAMNLTTADIAGKFYLSEYYFCHFFKDETGMSPVTYINKVRAEKAAVLLKSTNLPISEVAMRVGFNDSNYFSKIFKKYMGITPSGYRKRA